MEQLIKIIQNYKSKSKKKKLCFFLGSTKKEENKEYYLTPLRVKNSIVIFGAVVFNDEVAKKILKKIDGLVDYIFVDVEKKFKKKSKILDLEKIAKKTLSKTKLKNYKANDFAVEETEVLLNRLMSNQKSNLSKKKIIIIGCGNIGFKIALKLIDYGAKIYTFRRNYKSLKLICESLNLIKPSGTKSKIIALKKLPNNLKEFDVVISTANSNDIINLKHIKGIKKKSILIDIGKGNFSKNTIVKLMDKNIFVHRLDVTDAYFRCAESMAFNNSKNNFTNSMVKIKNLNLISQGIVGRKNDLIVDSVIKPKRILGICDGKGSFLNLSIEDKLDFKKKIKSATGINIKYD